MQRESEEPVRALRARVAEERHILEELRLKFNHPSMKESVKRALFDLDDVESVFLATLDKTFRTAPEEVAVIRSAEVALQIANSKRKQLQETMMKYGVDAMLIS